LNGRLQTLTIGEAAAQLPEQLRDAFLTPEAPEHRILPDSAPYPNVPNTAMGMSDGSGSNNWAVAGWRTRSGKALLCSDPHQPFWTPSSWYEYVVRGPEDEAGGAGHPGVPGLLFGTNGTIAWGITNNAASQRDLYREKVHPDDPNLYRDGDNWRRFEERVEEVHVRGQSPVRQTQRSTVRGPVVNHVLPPTERDGSPLALRWVGHEHLEDVRALVNLGRARDWDSFRAALHDWSLPAFNFGYADASGRVGYQCAGRIPLRGRVARGYRAANEPADAWQGYVPFDGLPSVVDPPRGYIASANERVAPDDYPYPLYGSFGAGHRAARLHQALANGKQLDREQAIALQNDVKSCRAERLVPPLVEWLSLSENNEVVVLRDALGAWDFTYTTDSIAPTLFETFMEVWQEHVARERFPEQLVDLVKASGGAAARLIERGDDDLRWFASDLRSEITLAAAPAVALVKSRHEADPAGWTWGEVHRAHWRHPLSSSNRTEFDIGPAPVNGGGDTVRNTGAGQPAFAASSGAEYRLIVDFAEPGQFLAVQNIGNSGKPDDPHYADQFADWLAGAYHTVQLHASSSRG
jgi:penicillin amidase